jgi:hypothetical protein
VAGVAGDITSVDFEIEGEQAREASRFGAAACIRSSVRHGAETDGGGAPVAWDSLPSGASVRLLAKAEGHEDGDDHWSMRISGGIGSPSSPHRDMGRLVERLGLAQGEAR